MTASSTLLEAGPQGRGLPHASPPPCCPHPPTNAMPLPGGELTGVRTEKPPIRRHTLLRFGVTRTANPLLGWILASAADTCNATLGAWWSDEPVSYTEDVTADGCCIQCITDNTCLRYFWEPASDDYPHPICSLYDTADSGPPPASDNNATVAGYGELPACLPAPGARRGRRCCMFASPPTPSVASGPSFSPGY